ncbi:MAG: RNA-binding transcriptional accessory protein [Clostridia bacterium]|nr:RNA-binding transcriptional accessory protein [Clostridia bacterium]
MNINEKLMQEFNLTKEHTDNVVALLDDGNTVPFIARYRKELTGHIDDQVLRSLLDRLNYLRNLETRKGEVEKSITEQGKFTDEIKDALDKAETLTEVEDIYRPYKKKKETRATKAIAKGLLPLAEQIYAQDKAGAPLLELAKAFINEDLGVNSAEEALSGASDIIAEMISDNAEIRKALRRMFIRLGVMYSAFGKGVDIDSEKAGVYEMYKEFSESVQELKSHRVLAINRGEKDGILKVKLSIPDSVAHNVIKRSVVLTDSPYVDFIVSAIEDAYKRLIEPSIEREVRSMLTENAQERAIKTFEQNLRPLLMQSPLKGKVVMGFDPGLRTGCKIAIVDETGKVLGKTVVYATLPDEKKKEQAKDILKKFISKFNVDVIAIGNGTASKESEIFIADLIKECDRKVSYIVVSEAGASVYSASELGAEEFPDFDVSERSAVSIARRLQDPLAELIKIDPKSIGVGQYQHDMPEARLDEVLGGTVEDCVNTVGVDLNTASASLLSYVAGLNKSIAKNVVEFRETNGKFTSRTQLLKVKKLGEKAFTQCAGFLRIAGGTSILDNTAVHPESYEGAEKLLSLFGYSDEDVKCGKLSDLSAKIQKHGIEKVSAYCGLGVDTIKDVASELAKPGRDVRDDLPKPVLRSDILSLSDLKEGMIISGVVRNVTDFGAFVDIGVHQDGLVHISELSDNFVRDPQTVVKVGQPVQVRVKGVDLKKNRISLSMKGLKK